MHTTQSTRFPLAEKLIDPNSGEAVPDNEPVLMIRATDPGAREAALAVIASGANSEDASRVVEWLDAA